MSRRTGLTLMLLFSATLTAGLWYSRREVPSEEPAPVIDRPEESAEAPPRLLGRTDAAPEPQTTDAAPPKPASPQRPWETRVGFDLGKEGEVRATGRVVFVGGNPAPNATVWKAYIFRPFFRTQAEKGYHDFFVAATKTDADGRYRFNKRQIRTRMAGAALLARHGELAALLLGPPDNGERVEIPDLVLGPAIHTRIDVATVYGDPIAGARARLEVRLGSRGGADMLLGDISNAEGRLSFLPLPDSTDLQLEVEVTHKQYPDTTQELDVDTLRRGGVVRVEIPTGRTVRGRIFESDGTSPERVFLRVAGYDAAWERQQLIEGVRGKPDEDGTFELRGVPAVESHLLVFRAAEQSRVYSVRQLHAHVFDLAPGRHGEVVDLGDLYLEEPGTIRGSVRGPDGEPVVGAGVEASVPINGTHIGGSAKTDGAGSFVIENLPAATYHLRTVHTFPGFGQREARLEGVRPGSTPAELKLEGGATLVVRFHPEGRPDRELRIHRYNYNVLSDPDDDGVVRLGAGGGGGSGRTELSLGGGPPRRTRGPGIPLLRIKLKPGTRNVLLTAKGYEPVTIGPVEIVEDRDSVVDVELTPTVE